MATKTLDKAAFFEAMDTATLSTAQRRRIARLKNAPARRQNRVIAAWQQHAADSYEQATGQKVTTLGDGTFLKWIFANVDTWLPALLKILALFGL
jgi:hypothetical protein